MSLAACIAIVAAHAAGSASADPARADAAAEEAIRLGASGDFAGAAAKFREAHRHDPRPQLLCNVGVAYFNAKDLPRAQRYLSECLQRASSLDATLVERVRSTLANAEASLRAGDFGPVDVVLQPPNATVTIDRLGAEDAIVGSRLIWLPFGAYSLAISAEGFTATTRDISVAARERQQLQIALRRAPAKLVKANLQRRSRTPAVVASAATGAIAIGATLVYLRARSIDNDVSDAATGGNVDVYDHLVSRAKKWQHASWGLAGLAGAGAIASGFLWYRSTTFVEVAPTPDGPRVSITTRW